MEAFFDSLTSIEWFFFVCAAAGGSLFLVRLLLMLMGGMDHDGDFHVDHDVHGDSGGHSDIGDADVKLLTFQGITAFFSIFGLTGLGCLRGGALNAVLSFLVALAAGLFCAWVVARLLTFMVRMQSSGTMDIYNALGEEGEVYLNIPVEGKGKVRVTLQGRLKVIDAVTREGTPIHTGEQVRVIGISGTSVLVVEKV